MRRKTLRERAEDWWRKNGRVFYGPEFRAWLAGYRTGKREGKAEAMTACGWGDGERRK